MDLIKRLKAELQLAADDERAFQMSAYMRDRFPFYGVMAAERRAIFTRVLKECGIPDDAMEVAKELFNEEKRELHICGQELLFRAKKQWKDWRLSDLEWFIVNKSWWDSVDFIASNLVGGFMMKHASPEDQDTLDSWNVSANIWLQRTTIIYQLKYKDKTNTKRLVDYILPHLDQKEFFIKKAIGWALREYSKTNPDWVRQFLNEHELQALSYKEASRLLR